MNMKKISIGLMFLILALVVVPGASAFDTFVPGATNPAHRTAAAAGCAGACHDMPVFCAGCHGNPTFVLSISATPISVTAGTGTPVTFTVRNLGTPGSLLPGPLVNGSLVSLSGAATGTGTTDSTGKVTISVNAAAGTVIATATKIGLTSGTTNLAVNPPAPVLDSVTISPLNQAITAGNNLQFTATPNVAGAALTWTSSNPAAGIIGATTGLFTSAATNSGSTIITVTATSGAVTVTNSTSLTVNPPAQANGNATGTVFNA